MEFQASKDVSKLTIELNDVESQHLLQFLLHAKFSDDIRTDIVGSPTMHDLLRGLIDTRTELGFGAGRDDPCWQVVETDDGEQPPLSFLMIESELKHIFGKSDVAAELKDDLFPFVWHKDPDKQRYFRAGTWVRVRDDAPSAELGSELTAIVAECWRNPDGTFEAYVILMDGHDPITPLQIPSEIRRYPTSDLII